MVDHQAGPAVICGRFWRHFVNPECSETPAEIEKATAFPDGFDAADLHERYEKARYGV